MAHLVRKAHAAHDARVKNDMSIAQFDTHWRCRISPILEHLRAHGWTDGRVWTLKWPT